MEWTTTVALTLSLINAVILLKKRQEEAQKEAELENKN